MNAMERGRVFDDGFIRGTAHAAAVAIRQFDQPTMALEILRAAGITPALMARAGVDPYDAEPCAECLRTRAGKISP